MNPERRFLSLSISWDCSFCTCLFYHFRSPPPPANLKLGPNWTTEGGGGGDYIPLSLFERRQMTWKKAFVPTPYSCTYYFVYSTFHLSSRGTGRRVDPPEAEKERKSNLDDWRVRSLRTIFAGCGEATHSLTRKESCLVQMCHICHYT